MDVKEGIAAEIGPGIFARPWLPTGEVTCVDKAYLFDSRDEAVTAASFFPGFFPKSFPRYYKVRLSIERLE